LKHFEVERFADIRPGRPCGPSPAADGTVHLVERHGIGGFGKDALQRPDITDGLDHHFAVVPNYEIDPISRLETKMLTHGLRNDELSRGSELGGWHDRILP
jgi:hypothetical protein